MNRPPLAPVACAAVLAVTAVLIVPARQDGPPAPAGPTRAECTAFFAVFYRELAPIAGTVVGTDRIAAASGDLAAALPGTDTSSGAVRDAALAVQRDAWEHDGEAFGRDAAQLLSLSGTLLAECGPVGRSTPA